jgi:arylsulfatase A-like enzyme
VILVSLDTFRADRLGCLGNTGGLTPNLDALAAEAVVFEQAYAQSDLTSMSHASVFTSRYPSELSVVGPRFRLGADPPTLADVLHVYGYDTAAFTAGGHLGEGTGLDRGFDTWTPTLGLGSFWHTLPPAKRWLDAHDRAKPYLLLVHSYDAHMPYLKPAPYGLAWAEPGYDGPAVPVVESPRGSSQIFDGVAFDAPQVLIRLEQRARTRTWDADARADVHAWAEDPTLAATKLSEADIAYVRASYDGAAAYADALLGAFLDSLKASGAYDDAIIVVFGDHGEALGEDGRFGHGQSLADASLHVPLIIRAPGRAPRRVSEPVALLDVMPTVLELTGATAPAGVLGHSLVPWLDGAQGPRHEVLYAEGMTRMISARDTTGRLTFSGVAADSPWLLGLMDLAAPNGPAWSIDTTTPQPDLGGALRAWHASLTPVASAVTVDPKQVEQMRKHGYWGAK